MKGIHEDIQTGKLKPVYLLYGEEAYLKRQYRDRLKTALLPGGGTMNYAGYEGNKTNPKELIDLAETMPFFAERRLIVVENSGFFKKPVPELADFLKEMPDTAAFVFVEEEVDKRGRMFKAAKEKGRAVEFGRQDEKTLLRWIGASMKREGKQIREQTARYLLSRVGQDMGSLEKEMEKLFSYTLGRSEVTMQDIDDICSVQVTNKIFDMVEAVALKQPKKALDYYYDLLALKEPAMRIFFLLCRQFRLLLEVRELKEAGMDRAQIAKTVGLPPFIAGKYMRQCGRFSTAKLRGILEEAAEYEERVKTGRLGDILCVELFIAEHSRA